MPDSRSGTEKALKDLQAYFVGALKRKAVEISERTLTDAERQEFQSAKAVEVNNFIAAKAFEALPAGMRVKQIRSCQHEMAPRLESKRRWYPKGQGESSASRIPRPKV